MRVSDVIHGVPLVDRDGKPNSIGATLLKTISEVLRRTGGQTHQWLVFPSYTVAQLQALAAAPNQEPPAGATAICSNETGGRTLCCYNATSGDFERVSDGAAISA